MADDPNKIRNSAEFQKLSAKEKGEWEQLWKKEREASMKQLKTELQAKSEERKKDKEASTKHHTEELEVQRKIAVLQAAGAEEQASIIQEALSKGSGSGVGAQQKWLDELIEINKDASQSIEESNLQYTDVEAKKKQDADVLEATIKNDPTQQSLADLTARIEKDNADIIRDTNFNSRASDKAMEKFSRASLFGDDKIREELGQAYKEGQKELAEALAIESEAERNLAVALAEKHLETIAGGVESEEKRTESAKMQQKQNSKMHQIGQTLIDNGEKLEKFASGALKAGGIFAGFAAIAMWFIDPEKMREIMLKIFDDIMGIFDSVKLLLEGDFTGFMEEMEGHWVTFGVILGVLAMVLLPKIMIALGGGLQTMNSLLNAAKVFRIFMMGTFVPVMIAGLTTIGTMMGFAAGGLAVVLVPVLAIVAVIGLLYAGFKMLQNSLGPGASIMDTLKVAMLYFVDFLAMIVNGITFIPRKILGFLGPRLLKWIMGDDFDTSFIDNIAGGLDTGRGARAAEDIRLKNEKAAAEKKMKEEEDGLEGLNPEDMTQEQIDALANNPTGGVDLENLTDTNLDLRAESGSGGGDISTSVNNQSNDNSVTNTNQTMNIPSLSRHMLDSLATR